MHRPAARKHAYRLSVVVLGTHARRGMVRMGSQAFAAALGRGGCRVRKREGDGATPIGIWRLDRVLYRSDRMRRPPTALPVAALARDYGWCDAVGDRNYNRAVRHPYPASAEHLWRDDGLYDIIVVLRYNERPRMQGRGSAIFMHVARPGYTPTEGCIALARPHLLRLLSRLGPGAGITVGGPPRKNARGLRLGR